MQGYIQDEKPELVSAMQVATWRLDADRYAKVKAVWRELEAATNLGQMLSALNILYDLLHEKPNA
jgi:NRPS condensation-like uncharacterized protein